MKVQALSDAQVMALRAKGVSRRNSAELGEKVAACLTDFLNDEDILGAMVNDSFPGVENATLAGKFRAIVKSEGLDELVYVSGSGGKTSLVKFREIEEYENS
jgi:hypothetical protein